MSPQVARPQITSSQTLAYPPEAPADKTPRQTPPRLLVACESKRSCPVYHPRLRIPAAAQSAGWHGAETTGLSRARQTGRVTTITLAHVKKNVCKIHLHFLSECVWGKWNESITLSAIFSFRKGLIIAKIPLKIRGSFMILTAFILIGNPSWNIKPTN